MNRSGWITWENKLGEEGSIEQGFTFFLNHEQATLAATNWMEVCSGRNAYPKKITYQEGLGKHLETEFISCCIFEIALCKKFRIIE